MSEKPKESLILPLKTLKILGRDDSSLTLLMNIPIVADLIKMKTIETLKRFHADGYNVIVFDESDFSALVHFETLKLEEKEEEIQFIFTETPQKIDAILIFDSYLLSKHITPPLVNLFELIRTYEAIKEVNSDFCVNNNTVDDLETMSPRVDGSWVNDPESVTLESMTPLLCVPFLSDDNPDIDELCVGYSRDSVSLNDDTSNDLETMSPRVDDSTLFS